MTKAAAAHTSISVIFNQSYLGIPTLPNEQLHGRYKTDAWRLIPRGGLPYETDGDARRLT